MYIMLNVPLWIQFFTFTRDLLGTSLDLFVQDTPLAIIWECMLTVHFSAFTVYLPVSLHVHLYIFSQILNCDDLDTCYLSLCHPESISHTSSCCQVMAVVSCRFDWQTTETPKIALCIHALCLSGSRSSVNHAQSLTHTNTWAFRAIISPTIYFKRICSPRKNTHYNLVVHNCSVARAGSIKGISVHWQRRPDRETDIAGQRTSFIYPSFSLMLCSCKLALCISCKLLYKN